MPTLLDRLGAGLDSASFDTALAGQVGQLADLAAMAADLRDNPSGIAGFASVLAGLAVPSLGDGRAVVAGLAAARGAIPAVTGGAAPAALADLARFGTLVADRLGPVLGRTVEAARAIEGLAQAEFHCPPGAPPPGLPSPPPPPSPASGQDRAAAAQARAAEISTRIDQLPSPLTPGALIDFLAGLVGTASRTAFVPVAVPLLDDVLLPVQTLAGWSVATDAEVGAQIETSLTLLRDRIATAATVRLDVATGGATTLLAPLRSGELAAFAAAWTNAAEQMAAALEAADPATAAGRAADMQTALDTFETLRTAQAADFIAAVPAIAARLRAIPAEAHDHLLHLAMQLEPIDTGALIAGLPRAGAADAAAQQALREALAPMTDFLEDLAEKLDLSAIEGEVAAIAVQAQEIAGQITAGLATIAQETRAAFAEVETAVADLPLAALAAGMRDGIATAGDRLEAAIRDGFAPLGEALASAIAALSQAIDALDPQAVREALAEAVAAVAGVLHNPEVRAAVEEIRAAIDQAAKAAGSLSFAPVTDEVIALIEGMTQGLRALGDTELNEAIKGLLSTALAVLPPDLRPVTAPLIDDLGVRIDQGPVALLQAVRDKPQQALDRIRAFDPARLADETLGGPFHEAVAAIEALRPSQLVAPLAAVLEAEKTRLRAEAAPSRALAPVTEAFDALLTEIDALSPDRLLQPIEAAVEKAIGDVIEASPVDEVFAEINQVFATIEAVLDTVQTIGATLDKAATALSALAGPDAAIDAWRDALLAKVDAVPNAAALDALLTGIAAAVDATRAGDLLARFDAGLAALAGELDALDAETVLAGMIALQQRLQPLVRAMPAGADRAAVEAALARFDPLDPAQAGGLRSASVLRRAIADARAQLVSQGAELAPLLHGPEGALSLLAQAAADASLLRAALSAEVDAALAPVRLLIGQLGGAALPLAGFAAAFADLHARLTTAVANILTGPASLQAISEAVQSVVDALRDIDLGFLRESLEGVFQAVRSGIEAAGPAPLLIALDREFGEVIDALDLDLLLPQAEIAALDAAAAALAGKLGALDPAELIGATVGPAFEAEVVPLIEALDVTPVFDVLIEALHALEVQLEAELGRVNTAYQQLLAARPAGLGGSASVGAG